MIDVNDFGKKFIFMPDATKGAIKSLTTKQFKDMGVEGIVVNTLHLLISAGTEKLIELGGIKKMMNWDGYVLSDSGGFQVFSLLHTGAWKGSIDDQSGATFKSPKDGRVYTITPESSIDIQMAIGSDVLVVLDDCRKAETTRAEAEEAVYRTLKWAERSKKHFETKYAEFKGKKLLTAVVQGANFHDLREFCAKKLVEMGFDGYNFGGYVLNDEGKLVVDQLKVVYDNTPPDKFNYAMGLGTPSDMVAAAEIGYKVFDTVLPTRNARHGTLFSKDEPDLMLRIKNARFARDEAPIDSTCSCEACQNHSRAYIHHLIKSGEMTGMTLCSIHNLRYYQNLIEELNSKV